MAMTDNMRKFAENISRGMKKIDAGLDAGYAESSIASRVSQLMKNPEVIAYLASLKAQGGGGFSHDALPLVQAAEEAEQKEAESITNSLEYLRSIYKNRNINQKTRIEAAKAALPYEMGKVGDVGKKQSQADDARELSQSDNDFATRGSRRNAGNLPS